MVKAKTAIYKIPVIPLKDVTVFPGMVIGIATTTRQAKLAAEAAYQKDKLILFLLNKTNISEPDTKDLFKTGTIGVIRQFLRTNGDVKLLVEGLYRTKVSGVSQKKPFIKVSAEKVRDLIKNEEEIIALRSNFTKKFRNLIDRGKTFPVEILISVLSTNDTNKLIDLIIPYMEAKTEEKQEILEEEDTEKRLEKSLKILDHNLSLLKLEEKLTSKTHEELNKMQKEVFLREQLKTIQKELGGREGSEFGELEEKIVKAGMPKDVENKAKKELARLKIIPSFSPEVGFIKTYLDWLVALPWSVKSKTEVDIKKAQKILDEDHYGLTKIKERVIEYLAVQKITGKVKGPILLFVGPPGTGKTSIGQSIAKATSRKFTRMSLGGIRDEAEIRGHRRTYVGALPGRIIQGIKNIGTRNPVFMLDEIDKVGLDFRGDPSAALLEALDPEQNFQFSDHYLEAPFDLSDCFFITTANILDTIPPALRDRMEVIPFPGYTEEEKFHIAKQFLIPKQLKINGLLQFNIKFKDDAISKMISEYTKEAGVRELERTIASVLRKLTRKISEGEKTLEFISYSKIKEFLGSAKYLPLVIGKKSLTGSSYALAVTPAGGEVLQVESAVVPGKGSLILTGQLGNVMKESAQASLTYVRSKLEKDKSLSFKNQDIHIHVPAGAVSKDGPSAGTAIAASLYSEVTSKPIRKDIAMTGEITLKGTVLRVGGIKEKVLAASRAGIKTVILPKENESDLEDIPLKTRHSLNIFLVSNMDEVLKAALT